MAGTQDHTSNTAVGHPEDLLAGFAESAVKWSATPIPDPNVSDAWSLRWRIGQAQR